MSDLDLEEVENVKRQRPNERPPTFGLTLMAVPCGSSSAQLLERVREVWVVVAAWGRWCDEALGDWPGPTEALGELPDWFRSHRLKRPEFEVEDWFNELHDRDWIWWSGAAVGDQVKLDINAESLPLSLQALRQVVEMAGGLIVAEGQWATDHEASRWPEPLLSAPNTTIENSYAHTLRRTLW
jgi:hypothetical protein